MANFSTENIPELSSGTVGFVLDHDKDDEVSATASATATSTAPECTIPTQLLQSGNELLEVISTLNQYFDPFLNIF